MWKRHSKGAIIQIWAIVKYLQCQNYFVKFYWWTIWLSCTLAQLCIHLTHSSWQSLLPELPWLCFSTSFPFLIILSRPHSLAFSLPSTPWILVFSGHHVWPSSQLSLDSLRCELCYMLFILKSMFLFHITKTCQFYLKMIPRVWPIFFNPFAIALVCHLSFGFLKDALSIIIYWTPALFQALYICYL